MRLMNPKDFMERYRAALEHAASGEDAVELALADTPTIDDGEVITMERLDAYIDELKRRSGPETAESWAESWRQEAEDAGTPVSENEVRSYGVGFRDGTNEAYAFASAELDGGSVYDFTGIWELDPQCQEYIGGRE